MLCRRERQPNSGVASAAVVQRSLIAGVTDAPARRPAVNRGRRAQRVVVQILVPMSGGQAADAGSATVAGVTVCQRTVGSSSLSVGADGGSGSLPRTRRSRVRVLQRRNLQDNSCGFSPLVSERRYVDHKTYHRADEFVARVPSQEVRAASSSASLGARASRQRPAVRSARGCDIFPPFAQDSRHTPVMSRAGHNPDQIPSILRQLTL